ncbi:MAG TPA: hypothetical protein VEI52_00965 [Terriglobales bacterium]|nr:hypothetical protein [Terriglobales bacterium]
MRPESAIRIGIALLCATSAFAQDRFENSAVNSYWYFDPTTTKISSRNFNPGGGAGIALNFIRICAIKAEAVDYSSVPFTKTYTSSQTVLGIGTTPAGTDGPQGNSNSSVGCHLINLWPCPLTGRADS